MKTIEVFDRPLCCSTGICGPSVDPALVQFAADLAWLKDQKVDVHRYNLAHEPGAFTRHADVTDALQAGQVQCLPLIRVEGRIVSQGNYPDRAHLAAWCGIVDEVGAKETEPSCCATTCCR